MKIKDFLKKKINGLSDGVKAIGEYKIVIRDENGNVKDKEEIKNLVVDDGLAAIASRVGDTLTNAFTYIALGSDSTAETSVDSALGSEFTSGGLSRVSATFSRVTTNVTNDTMQLENQFNVTASNSINEIGIFNAATGGDLLSRKVIDTKNVSANDTITITYKLYFE